MSRKNQALVLVFLFEETVNISSDFDRRTLSWIYQGKHVSHLLGEQEIKLKTRLISSIYR